MEMKQQGLRPPSTLCPTIGFVSILLLVCCLDQVDIGPFSAAMCPDCLCRLSRHIFVSLEDLRPFQGFTF